MKRIILPLTLAGFTTLAISQSVFAADPVKTLSTDTQKEGYSFGLMFGKRMKNDMPQMDVDTFVQGLKDGYTGAPAQLTDAQVQSVIQNFQTRQQLKAREQFNKLAEKNAKEGEAFLAANKDKPGVVTLPSGLQYKILKAGTGPQPTLNDIVTVHYTGSLINGKVFDSSVDRGQPATFPVKGVIPGWTEALQLMKKGAKWQLFIPAKLAYGAGGNRGIEPNSTLLFDVELLDIKSPDKK
jgi:FKBP-type peptidyl-prolyl cis-trans isomerase FklB